MRPPAWRSGGGPAARRSVVPAKEDADLRPTPASRSYPTPSALRRSPSGYLGPLALIDTDGPVIFPVTHSLHHDSVVFRTGPGTQLDAAAGAPPVTFEIDAVEGATRTGWGVVVAGTLAKFTKPEDLEWLRTLPLYPRAPGARARYVRVRPAWITAAASSSRPACPSPGEAEPVVER
jgi:hypothetical protein